MRAAAYPAFTVTAFQSRIAYRNEVWAGMFGELVFIFARIAIWASVFGAVGTASVDGVTLPQMITYALLAGRCSIGIIRGCCAMSAPPSNPATLRSICSSPCTIGLFARQPFRQFRLRSGDRHPAGHHHRRAHRRSRGPGQPVHGLAFLAFWPLSFVILFLLTAILA
jgi:hypothetical protein